MLSGRDAAIGAACTGSSAGATGQPASPACRGSKAGETRGKTGTRTSPQTSTQSRGALANRRASIPACRKAGSKTCPQPRGAPGNRRASTPARREAGAKTCRKQHTRTSPDGTPGTRKRGSCAPSACGEAEAPDSCAAEARQITARERTANYPAPCESARTWPPTAMGTPATEQAFLLIPFRGSRPPPPLLRSPYGRHQPLASSCLRRW